MKILLQIIFFLLTSNLFAQSNGIHVSIEKISFDKVVAFNYNLPNDTGYLNQVDYVIVNGKINDKLIKPGKILSSTQQNELIKVLNDTSSYGGYMAACFEPRLTYIFYKKKKIVGHIDICFECNQLESSILIPGYELMFNKGIQGFSELGVKKLLKLCHELNMVFCIEEQVDEE